MRTERTMHLIDFRVSSAKRIVKAHLNHPFAYLCRKKASKNEVFLDQYTGGSGRKLTARPVAGLRFRNPRFRTVAFGDPPTREGRPAPPDPSPRSLPPSCRGKQKAVLAERSSAWRRELLFCLWWRWSKKIGTPWNRLFSNGARSFLIEK